MTFVYGLFDRDGQLRYIGKANDPAARLKSHMRDARRRDTPVYRWIRKNGAPDMRVLFEGEDWQFVERALIAGFRAMGCELLNVAEGGDEPACPLEVRASNGRKNARAIHDDPARKQLWALKRGIGDNLRRGYVSEATKAKMRLLAQRQPERFGEWSSI